MNLKNRKFILDLVSVLRVALEKPYTNILHLKNKEADTLKEDLAVVERLWRIAS
jgi:Arc/MetJ family transcription regulator